jgi:BlaI family transcriptional regulator, penicillinase repressor
MNPTPKIRPTESELEILQVLWDKESATVREVHEVLEQLRDIGYTTTLKTMQIMTEKGMLSRDKSSRQHIYYPLVSRKECQQVFINKMVDGLFNGSAGRLVMGALDNKKLSNHEIREIRDYLNQFENDQS